MIDSGKQKSATAQLCWNLIRNLVLIFRSDVYSLCVAFPEPLADKLYNETKQFLEKHVQMILAEQVSLVGRMEDDDQRSGDSSLLQRYFTAWTEYSKGIEYLNYLYL